MKAMLLAQLKNKQEWPAKVIGESVYELWNTLTDICVDEDDCIEEEFLDFEVGTSKFDIWRWFEDTFHISVGDDLMNTEFEYDDFIDLVTQDVINEMASTPTGIQSLEQAIEEYEDNFGPFSQVIIWPSIEALGADNSDTVVRDNSDIVVRDDYDIDYDFGKFLMSLPGTHYYELSDGKLVRFYF